MCLLRYVTLHQTLNETCLLRAWHWAQGAKIKTTDGRTFAKLGWREWVVVREIVWTVASRLAGLQSLRQLHCCTRHCGWAVTRQNWSEKERLGCSNRQHTSVAEPRSSVGIPLCETNENMQQLCDPETPEPYCNQGLWRHTMGNIQCKNAQKKVHHCKHTRKSSVDAVLFISGTASHSSTRNNMLISLPLMPCTAICTTIGSTGHGKGLATNVRQSHHRRSQIHESPGCSTHYSLAQYGNGW